MQTPLEETIISMLPFFIVMFTSIVLIGFRTIIQGLHLKKLIIIPEFNLGEIKFYEFAALADNEISTTDIAAISSYYYLNEVDLDNSFEKKIKEEFGNKDFLKKALNILHPPKSAKIFESASLILNFIFGTENLKALSLLIYKKLKKEGFYVFNPALVSRIILIALIIIIVILYFAKINTEILLALTFFGFIFPLLPYYYSENLKKVMPLRRKLLGFKMFLKTTEYYKVKKDEVTFKKYIPYFILFGIHVSHTTEMVNYCLKNEGLLLEDKD